jgi:hypothetical protein
MACCCCSWRYNGKSALNVDGDVQAVGSGSVAEEIGACGGRALPSTAGDEEIVCAAVTWARHDISC